MRATVRLAKKHPWWTSRKECSVEHLQDMLKRVLKDKEMSDAKVGRWLGWMQAIVCCYSPAGFTLETFKDLNRRYSDKKRGKAWQRKSK